MFFRNAAPPRDSKFAAAVIKNAADISTLDSAMANIAFAMPQSDLSESEWTLTAPDVLMLIKKLRGIGTPMKKYAHRRMHYGVKTGRDSAFIINAEQRSRLVAEDPKSAELIKPWLNGKEVRKWRMENIGEYIIFATKETDINSYPAIKRHLTQHKDSLLRCASPPPEYWYALQAPGSACAHFGEHKIVYGCTSKEMHAFIDCNGFYVGAREYVIFSSDKEYLLGIMNSELMDFYYRHTFPSWGDPWNRGRIHFNGFAMSAVPIYEANKTQREEIARRVKEILESPQGEDVPRLESEIDELVYEYYGLTKKEIALVKQWQSRRRNAERGKPK